MKWIWILSLNSHPIHAYTHGPPALRDCGSRNDAEAKRINALQKLQTTEEFYKTLSKRDYYSVTKVPVS